MRRIATIFANSLFSLFITEQKLLALEAELANVVVVAVVVAVVVVVVVVVMVMVVAAASQQAAFWDHAPTRNASRERQ